MNWLCLAIIVSLWISGSLPLHAQNRTLISSGCRQKACWKVFALGKRILRQDQLHGKPRMLYQVTIEKVDERGQRERSTDWVQCSTVAPYVAFTMPNIDANTVFIQDINPGGEVYGYNIPSHQSYWAICHNKWNIDPTTMQGEAKSLGYSMRLKTEQRQVTKAQFRP